MRTQDRSRQILVHGLMLVMAGLLWEFLVPHTAYPRLALGAHIQLARNGMLLLMMAALLLALIGFLTQPEAARLSPMSASMESTNTR